MKDKNKTKGQLLNELAKLRQKIAEFEKSKNERKQMEKALQEVKAKLHIMFESIGDGIVVTDLEANIVEVNNGILRMGGYSHKKELIGQSAMDFVSPKDRAKAMENLSKELEVGQSKEDIEYALLAKDGSEFVVESNATVLNDSVGNRVGLINVIRDINKRKEAEESLREKTAYLDQLFESAQEGIVVTDKNGKVIRVNKEFLTLFGYTHDEVIGKTLDELISSKDLYAKARSITLDVARGREITYETVRQRNDKKLIDVSVLASPIIIDGELVAVYGIYRDITERKREEAVRNVLLNISKATPKTIGLDDLLATIHEQIGTLMDAKNFYVCLAHDTKKNLYTFPYYKDINPEDIVDSGEIFEITEGLTHHVLKTKKYLLVSKEELKKIGVIGTVPESWLGVPLKTESGDVNGLVAVQSYEKEAYTEKDAQVLSIIASNIAGLLTYKKTENKIRASLKEKEVLLQEVHHRVKNNMQLISSLFNLQAGRIKDKQAFEIFKSSQNRVRSMALIHERLYQSKDLTRIDFAEYSQSLTTHLFSSYEINTNVIKFYINIKDVFLDINTGIPCSLIINELVTNSLKHGFPNGKKGEIKIAMHPLNKNEVELVVSDNGIGLPKEVDFRSPDSLGLHLVTILAEDQLHGAIKLGRERGTIFHIRFGKKR